MSDTDLSATPLSDLPASSTATPTTITDVLPGEIDKETTPKKNRCFSCRKKVGLTGKYYNITLIVYIPKEPVFSYLKLFRNFYLEQLFPILCLGVRMRSEVYGSVGVCVCVCVCVRVRV